MRVAVIGLGHLGTVAAACLAEAGIEVWAWDPHISFGEDVQTDEQGIPESDWHVRAKAKDAVEGATAIWIAIDTPLNGETPDVDYVFRVADQALMHGVNGQVVLVSSQLPVGSVAKLAAKYPNLKFYCSPENLRRGTAVENFKNPGRVIVGTPDYPNEIITSIFAPFCKNLFWCTIESAEFAKHALNAFLATSIAFANELGQIAIKHGANPTAVEWALKSDERIGQKAYLGYGKGGLGPHLSRDIAYLLELAPEAHLIRGVQRASDDWETCRGG